MLGQDAGGWPKHVGFLPTARASAARVPQQFPRSQKTDLVPGSFVLYEYDQLKLCMAESLVAQGVYLMQSARKKAGT